MRIIGLVRHKPCPNPNDKGKNESRGINHPHPPKSSPALKCKAHSFVRSNLSSHSEKKREWEDLQRPPLILPWPSCWTASVPAAMRPNCHSGRVMPVWSWMVVIRGGSIW